MKSLFPQRLKNIYHLFQAVLADVVFGFPSRKIKVIGITGTNGKTTTVQMAANILEEVGYKVAVASTINFKIGEKEWINKTKFTTVSSFAIQKFVKRAVKEGCEYLVLETSSHSLDQYRVWGIKYDVTVIINVTREHLDYHNNIKQYRDAKLKLFKYLNKEGNKKSVISHQSSVINVAVVNLDMENPEEYLDCGAKNKFGYSTKNHESRIMNQGVDFIVAKNIEIETDNSKFMIHDSKFIIHLPGLFNIENALAATCVGLSQGIDLETISKALEKIKGVSGRMEYVPNERELNIIVDYAVTPDSLEKLYSLISDIGCHSRESGNPENSNWIPQPPSQRGKQVRNDKKNKIISVLGSCGERDRGKRPIMGEIVSRTADYVIVTNEDPYGENPVQIINEVFSGVVGSGVKKDLPNYHRLGGIPLWRNKFQSRALGTNDKSNPNDQIQKSENSLTPQPPLPSGEGGRRPGEGEKIEGINAWRILDRREAIKKALLLAKPGDFVIITGKGAEETMAIGKQRIPWNDKKVILEELKKLAN